MERGQTTIHDACILWFQRVVYLIVTLSNTIRTFKLRPGKAIQQRIRGDTQRDRERER